ncbi:MAG: hypothetical protein JXA33_10160, partial [Anaerolineae bacterium]|nr:hypothetical protein [Anaerolineae bacterium]
FGVVLLISFRSAVSVSADPGILYVAPDADCGDMTPCYGNLQTAVDAANAGDEIRVAAGRFTDINVRLRNDISPTGSVTQVVYISKTVTIRGGYNTDFSAWDPKIYTTTLDAQEQGRVFYITGNINPVVEGLHITGGKPSYLEGFGFEQNCGGGIYVITATVIFSNNQIVRNGPALFGGGGVCLLYCDATLSDNTVLSNRTVEGSGGGLYVFESIVSLSDNIVRANHGGSGGGLHLRNSHAMLTGNTFASNSGYWGGGGLSIIDSEVVLDRNTIVSNTTGSTNPGGGMYVSKSTATLSSNIVAFNTADRGGGVYLENGHSTITNNGFIDNQSRSTGSGLYLRGEASHLFHITIARNHGGDGSGIYVTNGYDTSGLEKTYSTVALSNIIVVSHSVGISVSVGNTVTVNGILWHSLPITVSKSVTATVTVQNQYQGDPAFAADGYHITSASTALDKGVPTQITTDIDGEVRPQGIAPDLGADEIGAAALPENDESLVTFANPDGVLTELSIPVGAVTESLILVYTLTVPTTTPPDFLFVGRAFDLNAYRNGVLLEAVSFSPASTITLHYTDADVVGLNEEQLYLYTWIAIDEIWEDAACGDYIRHPAENWLSAPICHLSQFGLFGTQTAQPSATITKRVSPEGQIQYGDELTYTLVISGAPGSEVNVYDPLTTTTLVRFVEQPTGINYANHTITGTMMITPTNQMTVSFVVRVGVPGTIGIFVDVSNTACIYPAGQTISMCEWSNTVTNQAYRPHTIFLPLVVRNQ